MPNIKSFKGYYYNQEIAGSLDNLIAPPYDIISPSQREELYNKSPFNIIRVILGKDHPDDNSISNKYSRAAEHLGDWISKNILKRDNQPALYLLKQEFEHNSKKYSRSGFFALIELVDFDRNQVFPHEETLNAPKADRLKLLEAVKAHFSPIFSFYFDNKNVVESTFDKLKKQPPFLKVTASNGIKNSLWRVVDKNKISKITQMLKNKQVFIADGHHRYETALNYKKLHPQAAKDGADSVLMYFANIEQGGFLILPTYRLIKKLNTIGRQEVNRKIKEFFDMQKMPDLETTIKAIETTDGAHKFGLFSNNEFFVLTLKNEADAARGLEASLGANKSDDYKKLDVTILDEFLIKDILAVNSEEDISFTKNAGEAVALVKAGEYEMAFFLKPTRLTQIKNVALCGERMPKKATYFYPKLLSGLLINKF